MNGATVLADGRILSWSDDGTLHLWDGTSGNALATVLQMDAAHQAPELHQAWRVVAAVDYSRDHLERCADRGLRAGACSTSQGEAAGSGHKGRMSLSIGQCGAAWHGNGEWIADHLHPTGTLVGHCNKNLAFLQLQHGNTRVSIDEAAALLGVSDGKGAK